VRRVALLGLVLAAALAGCGGGGEEAPTLAQLEKKFICPTCHTTLELSNAPAADRMRVFIRERIEAGDSEAEITDALVAQFGEGVLASPPRRGFSLLAWALPLAGAALAVGLLALALRRWSRTLAEPAPADPRANGRPTLDPELERRLDEELARFDG
jgi:cytochrome c-type biogenesis protein CcmH